MGSHKKRPVTLTATDREELVRVTTTGVHPASMIRRAGCCSRWTPRWAGSDPKEVITARVGVSGETLGWSPSGSPRPAAREGHDGRKRRAHPPVPSPVTGEVEARLIALACSTPPVGHARWRSAAVGEARRPGRRQPRSGPLHHRPGPKKTELRLHLKKCWTIPPKSNTEFAARMEDVLAVYARPLRPGACRWCAWMRSPTGWPMPAT